MKFPFQIEAAAGGSDSNQRLVEETTIQLPLQQLQFAAYSICSISILKYILLSFFYLILLSNHHQPFKKRVFFLEGNIENEGEKSEPKESFFKLYNWGLQLLLILYGFHHSFDPKSHLLQHQN